MMAVDGVLERGRAATAPRIRVGAALAKPLRLVDIPDEQRHQPGGPGPPGRLLGGAAGRRPPAGPPPASPVKRLRWAAPTGVAGGRRRLEEAAGRVRSGDVREHPQPGLLVRADA